MVIDPLLIYGLGHWVMGAGLSTCVFTFLSLLIGIRWYAKVLTTDEFYSRKRLNKAIDNARNLWLPSGGQ